MNAPSGASTAVPHVGSWLRVVKRNMALGVLRIAILLALSARHALCALYVLSALDAFFALCSLSALNALLALYALYVL